MVLLFAAALLGGLCLVLIGARSYGKRSEAREETRRRLEAAALAAAAKLERAGSPDIDSPRDVAAVLEGIDQPDITFSIEDASSRIDPNFVDSAFLDSPTISSLLGIGSSGDELDRLRADKGLSTELSHYASVLPGTGSANLTGYGWANVDAGDPDSLGLLFVLLTGSEEGKGAFLERLAARRTRSPGGSGLSLAACLGDEYGVLYPFINAEPSMNAHFVPEALLEAVLCCPEFRIGRPETVAAAIVEAREDHDLGMEDLRAIIGADRTNPVWRYLGVRTWFWRIRASCGDSFCEIVTAVRPGGAGGTGGGGEERAAPEVVDLRFSR